MRSLPDWLLAGLLIIMLASCSRSATPIDPVDRVARRYGVPPQRVLEVADELRVNPAEIETFGSYFFPYNYYEHQFESFRLQHARPPSRSEVDQMVKGYVARCEEGWYGIEYIYYSTQTHYELLKAGEIAMVISISFRRPASNESSPQSPDDPVMDHMRPIELWDGSVNPPDEKHWDKCVQEYLRNH